MTVDKLLLDHFCDASLLFSTLFYLGIMDAGAIPVIQCGAVWLRLF